MLDAIAANVGMVVVCDLQGNLSLQGCADAKVTREADDASDVARQRSLVAGGDLFVDIL